jgi:hypothetical protein
MEATAKPKKAMMARRINSIFITIRGSAQRFASLPNNNRGASMMRMWKQAA